MKFSSLPISFLAAVLNTSLITASLITASGCSMNYSKSCSDGVCVITENGVTRYEGDPAKIAKLKAEQENRGNAAQARNLAYENATRRDDKEVIRVGVIRPTSSDKSIEPHAKQFEHWIEQAVATDPRIQLVDDKKLRLHLKMVETKIPVARGFGMDGPTEQSVVVPNEKTFMALRDLGIAADVLIFTSLSPKTESGFVSGGRNQGTGIASVSRVEISGVASSVYDFKPYRFSQVGKSAGSIDLAGFDKDGKAKSASLKSNKRNINLDKPASTAYGGLMRAAILNEISSKLPSLAEVERIQGNSQQGLSATESKVLDTMNALNKMLSK